MTAEEYKKTKLKGFSKLTGQQIGERISHYLKTYKIPSLRPIEIEEKTTAFSEVFDGAL